MANYFTLELDTTPPSGVTLTINSDEIKTAETTLNLAIGCSDASTQGYLMKVWGDAIGLSEDDALWESYSTEKTVTLSSSFVDGVSVQAAAEIYVKIRDDVWNESAAASDSIIFYKERPVVTVSNVTRTRLSNVEGRNKTTVTLTFNMPCDRVYFYFADSVNDTREQLGNEFSGHAAATYFEGNTFETELDSNIFTEEGAQLIKVFARAYGGDWSV